MGNNNPGTIVVYSSIFETGSAALESKNQHILEGHCVANIANISYPIARTFAIIHVCHGIHEASRILNDTLDNILSDVDTASTLKVNTFSVVDLATLDTLGFLVGVGKEKLITEELIDEMKHINDTRHQSLYLKPILRK